MFEVEQLTKDFFSKAQEEDLMRFLQILKSRERSHRNTNWFCKSIIELMNSKTRVGSYIKYPADHLRVISANQHAETNSSWFSLPTGSEDTSFKILRKNEFEDKLFKCEDDIYECDMNIAVFTATINAMESIKSIEESKKMDTVDPKLFQPARLAAIYSYYNDRADEVINYLRSKPIKTVETILPKLKQRLEAYKKQYQDNNKHWTDICNKNFSKSLDHRSFYFKQNEKRHIHSKFFIQDVKSRSTERQKHPLNILKGGCALSPFYISFSALQQPLDEFIIPNDEIADLSEDVARTISDKLPHYQLLFNDQDCMALTIRVILHSISLINNRQQEKDKMIGFLNTMFLYFFEFPINADNDILKPVSLDDDDVHNLTTDEYKKQRIENPTISFESILANIKGQKDTEHPQKEAVKAEPIKPTQIQTNRRDLYKKLVEESKVEEDPQIMRIEKQNMTSAGSQFLPIKSADKKLLFGNQHIYSFLRFFHVLYERLIKVRRLLKDQFMTDFQRIMTDGKSQMDSQYTPVLNEGFYTIFMSIFCSLAKGKLEVTKYEDFCKNWMGQKAYLVFTLDKLVNSIIKILQQHLIGDELSHTMMELFVKSATTNMPNSDIYLYRFNKAIL